MLSDACFTEQEASVMKKKHSGKCKPSAQRIGHLKS